MGKLVYINGFILPCGRLLTFCVRVPILAFESVAFSLAARKSFIHLFYNPFRGSFSFQVMQVFLRDSIIYFLVYVSIMHPHLSYLKGFLRKNSTWLSGNCAYMAFCTGQKTSLYWICMYSWPSWLAHLARRRSRTCPCNGISLWNTNDDKYAREGANGGRPYIRNRTCPGSRGTIWRAEFLRLKLWLRSTYNYLFFVATFNHASWDDSNSEDSLRLDVHGKG